jgi:hypothetical protein
VPDADVFFVSWNDGGKWTTREYDHARLPAEVLKLWRLVAIDPLCIWPAQSTTRKNAEVRQHVLDMGKRTLGELRKDLIALGAEFPELSGMEQCRITAMPVVDDASGQSLPVFAKLAYEKGNPKVTILGFPRPSPATFDIPVGSTWLRVYLCEGWGQNTDDQDVKAGADQSFPLGKPYGVDLALEYLIVTKPRDPELTATIDKIMKMRATNLAITLADAEKE